MEAARPKTLPAAIAPVLVGSGLAAGDHVFRLDALVACLVGALAIQVAANFANDASDAARGADTADRQGPARMVASGLISPRAMWTATWLAIGVAAIAGAWLIAIAGWVVAAIGIVSIAALLTYVGGPIPYGYRGFGELSVLVFFGLVATVGTRYTHDRTAPADAWWLGLVMGALAAAILVANNLRDLETDSRSGKRTLAVLIGPHRTRRLYMVLMLGPFVVIGIGAVVGVTPPATAFAVFLTPFAGPLIRTISGSTDPGKLIAVLAGTARLQLLTGAVLAAGAAIGS